MHPIDVLVKPLLSEKSNEIREATGKYFFRVRLDATKAEIAKAVSQAYGVKVIKVQTLITRGKVKIRRNHASLGSKVKKAVVTLEKGQKLPLFEDQ